MSKREMYTLIKSSELCLQNEKKKGNLFYTKCHKNQFTALHSF